MSHVALTKCYVCHEDNEILLATTYKQNGDPVHDLSKYDGMVTNGEPCNKCKEYMDQGVILISVRDGEEAEIDAANKEKRLPNPYRTGGWCVVKDRVIADNVQPKELADHILKQRMVFIPDAAWDQWGLPRGDADAKDCTE